MYLVLLAIIFLFVSHYVGDFVLQTRKMANNKLTSYEALTDHGLIVSTFIFIAMCTVNVVFNGHNSIIKSLLIPASAAISYGILHAIQDRLIWKRFKKTVCKKNLVKGTEEFERLFFLHLGADQMMHMVVLFTVIYIYIL